MSDYVLSANVEGAIRPGAAGAGELLIDGDLLMYDSALFEVELGGLQRGDEHDSLVLAGDPSLDARLAGALSVSFLGGFLPTPGNRFEILTAPWIFGSFHTVELPDITDIGMWDYAIGPSSGTPGMMAVTLRVLVPEPTPALLLATGLAGLAAAGRRRARH